MNPVRSRGRARKIAIHFMQKIKFIKSNYNQQGGTIATCF